MSRSGKRPIALPKGVEITCSEGKVKVKGPNGELSTPEIQGVSITIDGDQVVVSAGEDKALAQWHGLQRALVNSMITGVSKGFEKRLEMIGVGYKAAVKGTDLELSVGFSHPTVLAVPQGLQVDVEKNTTIVVKGADPQVVGQFAANIRGKRPPEPYKGKGIRYVGEFVRRKAGKANK